MIIMTIFTQELLVIAALVLNFLLRVPFAVQFVVSFFWFYRLDGCVILCLLGQALKDGKTVRNLIKCEVMLRVVNRTTDVADLIL